MKSNWNQNCPSCFKVLAVKSRFTLFEYLKKSGKKTVNELVNLLGLRQPTVTFHLNFLAKERMIKKIKVGREVFCQINKRCQNCPLFS
ncbi:hypothetical protein A2160_01150 [Candidatus Beckwithbacteria bacterium RBG_13_42_9]|uniref:HTH arsR-type domain-containing protein n=1 Tax=Candidatus Beckwithbacteria bacterium RBG_13_42_9 TaxID=1797457 RepID=A0A1F5E3J5_9BACT|nr:MAG: hypothetical protein A2160_01150 [Candidatus Beckwithbacteria bacterium RBG_13_42_9]